MSANSGLLLSTSGLFNVASVYYSPIATIPTTGVALSKIYCILSQTLSLNISSPSSGDGFHLDGIDASSSILFIIFSSKIYLFS